MLKRSLKLTLEFLAVLVAGFTVLLVLAAVRLSYGPVPLDFVTPYVERGLSADDGSYTVRIQRTVLTWAGWERTLDVQLSGVRVSAADGTEKAFVPELAISFSIRAMIDGRLAPTRLELFSPRVRVVRLADGTLALGEVAPSPGAAAPEAAPDQAPAPAARAPVAADLTAELLSHLTEPGGRGGPLDYLRSVSLLNADFVFEDPQAAVTIRAPGSDIVLSRDRQGLGVNARLSLATDGTRSRILIAGGYSIATRMVEFEARLDGFEPATLASLAPALRPLDGARLPVSGTVTVRAAAQGGKLREVAVDLRAASGTVGAPTLFDAPVTVRSARLRAHATENLSRLVVEAFTADLGGPAIAVSGSGARNGDRATLTLEVGARNVSTDDVKRLWPKGAASGGRDWVLENVEKGGVSELRATTEITARIGETGIGEIAVAKLDGGFDFAGLDLHFLRPLPPVTGVAGRATLSPTAITFEAKSGRLGALIVSAGTFRAFDLDKDMEQMEIETVASGPIADAVRLLNHPRLDLVKGLGISPSSIKGAAATRIRLKFPLRKDLSFDHMEIAAASNVRGAMVPGVVLGNDLADGDLALQLDKRGMDVKGKARLGGVPVDLEWTENFQKNALFRSHYHVKGTADDAARERFGVGFLAPYAKGPMGADLIVTRYNERRIGMAAALNLRDTALKFDELGWQKDAGTAGTARLTLLIEDEKVKSVQNIAVRAGDLTAAGTIALAPDGKSISGFDFSELRYGETDLRASGSFRDDGGLTLDLSGRKADIRYFLAQEDDGGPKQPLDITVNLATVRAAPEAVISSVSGRLVRDTSDWQVVDVRGTVGDGKPLTMTIGREGATRKLHIASEDAGAALKAFDITENMVGGALNIDGTYDDTKPKNPLTGHFAVRDFRMVKAPFLAKLLSVASLTGLFDALTGQGISFARADVPFVKTGDEIVLKDSRAYGSAVGFTAEGKLDVAKDTLDLKGTVVPAYILNSFFADIPILGSILVPEKGSGLFAATYSMRGPIENPDVSVNPLATLTPGFLRGLFNIFDAPERKKEAPAKQPVPEKAPEPSPVPAPAQPSAPPAN